jgi:hypothetical protein
MGYDVYQRGEHFKIKRKNFDACLQAIKGMGTKDFAWVSDREVQEATSLKEAFKAWNWDAEVDRAGIVCIHDDCEKIGDEAQLFQAIAPYVESGCYIEMSGEDGALWRWQFEDGKFFENNATLDWEGSVEIVEQLLKQKALLPTLLGLHPMLDKKIGIVLGGKR